MYQATYRPRAAFRRIFDSFRHFMGFEAKAAFGWRCRASILAGWTLHCLGCVKFEAPASHAGPGIHKLNHNLVPKQHPACLAEPNALKPLSLIPNKPLRTLSHSRPGGRTACGPPASSVLEDLVFRTPAPWTCNAMPPCHQEPHPQKQAACGCFHATSQTHCRLTCHPHVEKRPLIYILAPARAESPRNDPDYELLPHGDPRGRSRRA